MAVDRPVLTAPAWPTSPSYGGVPVPATAPRPTSSDPDRGRFRRGTTQSPNGDRSGSSLALSERGRAPSGRVRGEAVSCGFRRRISVECAAYCGAWTAVPGVLLRSVAGKGPGFFVAQVRPAASRRKGRCGTSHLGRFPPQAPLQLRAVHGARFRHAGHAILETAVCCCAVGGCSGGGPPECSRVLARPAAAPLHRSGRRVGSGVTDPVRPGPRTGGTL
jgi:hypothetical protein